MQKSSVRVFRIAGRGARAPSRNARSGGKVIIWQNDPPGGGESTCANRSISVARSILAGVLSVAQMTIEENPGRAGSVRRSGEGPSWTAFDFPSGPSARSEEHTSEL